MNFQSRIILATCVLSAIVQLCSAQGCCCANAGCMCDPSSGNCGAPPQCLAPASPYEAMAAAMAVPPPNVPQPPIPQCPPMGPLLQGCGPPPSPIQIFQVPAVMLPGPETPVIELPTPPLPPPQVLAHRAVVSKAVMKPQVYQRLVHIPITARFLKKAVVPVVENIQYTATPKCCGPEAPVPMVCAKGPCVACGGDGPCPCPCPCCQSPPPPCPYAS